MPADIVKIVSYEDRFKEAFKSLNEAWIRKYFTMEEADYQALNYPKKKIIDPGGAILMAVRGEEAVGTCALIPMADGLFDYELAKMGVAPHMRGKGIGLQLGRAILEKARELGGKTIYLESNTVLEPAINLYKKLGFVKIDRTISPYDRCNIQMVCHL